MNDGKNNKEKTKIEQIFKDIGKDVTVSFSPAYGKKIIRVKFLHEQEFSDGSCGFKEDNKKIISINLTEINDQDTKQKENIAKINDKVSNYYNHSDDSDSSEPEIEIDIDFLEKLFKNIEETIKLYK